MREQLNSWSDDYDISPEQLRYLKDFTDKKIVKMIDEVVESKVINDKDAVIDIWLKHKLDIRNESLKKVKDGKITIQEASMITKRFGITTGTIEIYGDITKVYEKLSKKYRKLVKSIPNQ